MPAFSFGRIWKDLRLHRPSSYHGNLSRKLSSSVSRELNDEQLPWLSSPDSRVYQGPLKSCPLDLLQKLLLGVRSCTGSDRSLLLLHHHSRNTSCSGASAWGWLRAQTGKHHQQPSEILWGGICGMQWRGYKYNPFVPPKAFSPENGLGERRQWDAGAITQGEA